MFHVILFVRIHWTLNFRPHRAGEGNLLTKGTKPRRIKKQSNELAQSLFDFDPNIPEDCVRLWLICQPGKKKRMMLDWLFDWSCWDEVGAVCTPCRPTECFRRRQSRYQLAVSTRSQLRIKALLRKKLFKLQRRDRPQEAKSIPVTAVVPYSTAYM